MLPIAVTLKSFVGRLSDFCIAKSLTLHIKQFLLCMQKQEAVLMASAIDLAHTKADMTALWQAAALEERREALFSHLTRMYI